MKHEELIKSIAELGYNVGFGAKKHFATYDIVGKVPGLISFISIAFGIYSLIFESLSTKTLSASFLVLGLVGIYISFYDSQKESYRESGERLTKIFYSLRDLYGQAKQLEGQDDSEIRSKLEAIRNEYFGCCVSKQIMFSDWYAHYKFFWQQQIEWIDEVKHFSFFRDKIPLSAYIAITIIAASLIIWSQNFISLLKSYLCTL